MRFPANTLVELFIAHLTFVPFHFAVDPHMLGQSRLPGKRFRTNRTRKRLLSSVNCHVDIQSILSIKLPTATRAYPMVRRMRDLEMIPQRVRFGEHNPTFDARVLLLRYAVRSFHVLLLDLPILEAVTAHVANVEATNFRILEMDPHLLQTVERLFALSATALFVRMTATVFNMIR